jgi:hypothetical protein
MSLTVLLDQPGNGCGCGRCPSPDADGFLCNDNTGKRLVLCVGCLTALIEACQPRGSFGSIDTNHLPVTVALAS